MPVISVLRYTGLNDPSLFLGEDFEAAALEFQNVKTYGIALLDRLSDPKNAEQILTAQYFTDSVSKTHFDDTLQKLIPNDSLREIVARSTKKLIESGERLVRHIYSSFY